MTIKEVSEKYDIPSETLARLNYKISCYQEAITTKKLIWNTQNKANKGEKT